MIELPEAVVYADQINQTLSGKRVVQAVANQSPHKFAWYTGDPAEYNHRLAGKVIGQSAGCAGSVEVQAGDITLILSTNLTYYAPGAKLPPKHQLWLEFEDGSALVATIQMWGGLFCVGVGEECNFGDYQLAKNKPSPLTDAFDRAYFDTLFNEETPKLSAKAFLATMQRIPGLGNGVLQDILWTAKIHPKCKMGSLPEADLQLMYTAVKDVLKAMVAGGGRDTDKDLFDRPGGYTTILSKFTVGKPCPACGEIIRKEPYLGGSIYYCPGCQRL